MKRQPLKLTFGYSDTPERKVISLERDGIACVPVIGFDNYQKVWVGPQVHCHPECIEISLCLRGGLDFEFRGEVRKLMPGNMAVSGPDDPHRFRSYPKRLSKYWMLFRIPQGRFPLLKLPTKEARWLVKELTSLSGRIFNGEKLESLFQRIFHIYDTVPSGSPERPLMMRSAVTELLLGVVECSKTPPQIASNSSLKAILEEMTAHPERAYSVPELAQRAGMSHSNLIKRFRKLTGLPPHAFLVAQRIARAKTLLADGGKTVAAVAGTLGFSSSQYFATCFRQLVGTMPREWRRTEKNTQKKESR